MNVSFAVIIPVYNTSDFLEKCVTSVLEQDYENFEIILVDDGSTDGSDKICDEFRNLSNVKVIHQANQGQIAARENGARESKADYLLFLDSDDWLESGALSAFNIYVDEYLPDCMIFGMKQVDDFGKTIDEWREVKKEYYDESRLKELYYKVFETRRYNSMCRKVIRREIFWDAITRDNQFYNIRIGEDAVQSANVILNSKSVLFIEDVFYDYRVNLKSVTHKHIITDDQLMLCVQQYEFEKIKGTKLFTSEDLYNIKKKYLYDLYKTIIWCSIASDSFSLFRKRCKIIGSSLFYNVELKDMIPCSYLDKKCESILLLYKNSKYGLLYVGTKLYIKFSKNFD